MPRYRVVIAAVLVVSGAVFPLAAQVPSAPRGKVPGASPGKIVRPSPSLMPLNPSRTPQATVTPQSVLTSRTAPVAAIGAFTAGLSLQPFAGGSDAARLEYARTLARNLDSVAVSLVNLFRGTSGQPMSGATGPTALSVRERNRWTRCRDIYWDFTSLATAVQSLRDGLSPTSPLYSRAAALDTALADIEALAECDNVASMISAPERWVPWPEQYTGAAQHFYSDWYAQMWEAHEKDRAFVLALNAALPAGQRMPFLPGLPRTPPYAGAAVVR